MVSRRYASYEEKKKLDQLMIEHSDAIGDNPKERQWHEGWDYRRVAAAANAELGLGGGENFDLNHNHGRHIAKELGITLHEFRPGVFSSDMERRVAKLERHMEQLATQLGVCFSEDN
jgi:hypothetical protein